MMQVKANNLVGATILLVAFMLTPAAIGDVPRYSITDLGDLPSGEDHSDARGINGLGVVVGKSYGEAFLWQDGSMQALGFLPGGYASAAACVNDAGQVVGDASTDGGGVCQPFIWTEQAGMTNLGTILGTTEGAAWGINNQGCVIGTGQFQGQEQAFTWSEAAGRHFLDWTDQRILPHMINDSGQIAGAEWTGSTWRAFVYDCATGVSYIDPPAPFDEGSAGWIGETGRIVGSFTDRSSNTGRGFAYDGIVTLLEPLPGYDLSYARRGNEFGMIIGVSGTGTDPAYVGTVWINGQPIALDTLVDNAPGWVLCSPQDINDVGQIVGYGINPDGATRAFLLTPVPEPFTLGVLATAGTGLLGRHARRYAR